MAAGVGKTYRMLLEGRQAQEEGADVVIGYLEPHDRPETTALADGLEVVPRLRAQHGSLELEEMDLDAVLARAPQLALVDELAHTNAAGMRNEKRWQDIDDILDAGIDVISTVNIQHLESLNDAIFELTEVRVRSQYDLGAALHGVTDGWQARFDAAAVSHLAVLERNVEVDADERAATFDAEFANGSNRSSHDAPQDFAAISRARSSIRLEKPHSLSYQACTSTKSSPRT
jgi:hypothetical protein